MKRRGRLVERLARELPVWAGDLADLRGVCFVGSYAYRRPRMSSDVDLALLSNSPTRYGAWLGVDSPLRPAHLLLTRMWGPVTELRFRHRSGLQFEVGVTTPARADTDPLDLGTARVIGDGLRVLYDPDGILTRAEHANRG